MRTNEMTLREIRSANINYLRQQGFPVDNISLPLIDRSEHLRNKSEIGNRINVLLILYAIYLEGKKSSATFKDLIYANNWQTYLSGQEKQSIDSNSLTNQDLIDFSWKKESIFALLFVIKIAKKEDIFDFNDEIDISDYYSEVPPENEFGTFLKGIKTISTVDILSVIDLYYIAHHLSKNKIVKGLSSSIIMERRKALEWVINPDIAWDDISLDT